MQLTEFRRYHVELVHEPIRLRTFWVMCSEVVPDAVVSAMLPGVLDTVDMFVSAPPLLFMQTELPEVGRISRHAAFLRSDMIGGMPSVLLTNSEFWRVIEGDDFYAQLSQLGMLFAGDFREAVRDMERLFNLHVIAV